MNYYRARWYDSNVGRFISEDPIGFSGGDVNLYGYVWNNPVNLTDPSGLMGESDLYGDREFWNKKRQETLNIDYAGRDYDPQYYRCGPSQFNPLSMFVGNNVGGDGVLDGYYGDKFSFAPACVKHDGCYPTCGQSQQSCDDRMLMRMYQECDRYGGEENAQCHRWAVRYYVFIRVFGNSPYHDCQKRSGCG